MEVFETFKSALNHRVSLAKVEEAKRRMQKHLKATKHLAEIKSVEFDFLSRFVLVIVSGR